MKENKALTKTKSANAENSESTLARVDVSNVDSGIDGGEREVLIQFGRLKESQIMAGFAGALLAEKLSKWKRTKMYKALGATTWEDFIQQNFPFSVDTADRKIKDFEDLGATFVEVQEIVKISRAAWIIAGERFKLTASNAAELQHAFKQAEEETRRAKDQASALKSDLDKTRGALETARKVATETHRKLREAQSPALFAEADEDHQTLLRIQSNWDHGVTLLARVRERQLSPENEARYIGLAEYLYRSALQVIDEARYAFGRGENMPDPADALYLHNVPDTSRNLAAEHLAETVPNVAAFKSAHKKDGGK